MKVGIFANGEYGKSEFYLNEVKKLDYIIGVDGGNNFLRKLNILPNLAIGDFDSIDKKTFEWLKNVEKIVLPTDKDNSDTYIALEHAASKSKDVILFGGLGKRVDHTFSNILLLSKFNFVFKEEYIQIFKVTESKTFKCRVGETWSLLPLKNVKGLKIEGFKYEAENVSMPITNPFGLSNVTVSSVVKIAINSGILVVFKNII